MLYRICALALVSCSFLAVAESPCRPPMVGEAKVAVTYIPSKNWSDFSDTAPAHVRFLVEQMQQGHLQFAGPFLKDGEVDGGMAVFNGTDTKQVEAWVSHDPLVQKSIVVVKVQPWLECTLK